MFNFYVVLTGHDMVTDASRATTRRPKFKVYQQKVQSLNDLPKTWNSSGKSFEDFRQKNINSGIDQTTQWNTRHQHTTYEFGPGKLQEPNLTKLGKEHSDQKLLELRKTRLVYF